MCLPSSLTWAATACSLWLWDSRGFSDAGLFDAAVLHPPADWGLHLGDEIPFGAVRIDALSLWWLDALSRYESVVSEVLGGVAAAKALVCSASSTELEAWQTRLGFWQ